MSVINFEVLRFDNEIIVDNGIIHSDNENGRHGLVEVFNNNGYSCGYFEVIDNSELLDLFKGTTMSFKNLREMLFNFDVGRYDLTETCIINVKVGENNFLLYNINNRIYHFNSIGLTYKDFLVNSSRTQGIFKNHIIYTIKEIVTFKEENKRLILKNSLTNEKYGEFVKIDDFHFAYSNERLNLSTKEFDLVEFYSRIAEDIIQNGKISSTIINSFEELSKFLSHCSSSYKFNTTINKIKGVKAYPLYDKVILKGKTTLVPDTDSKFICNLLRYSAEESFVCYPCVSGTERVITNAFLKSNEYLDTIFNVELSSIKRKNIQSKVFYLEKNNDINSPEIYYKSSDGEIIKLMDYNYRIIRFEE